MGPTLDLYTCILTLTSLINLASLKHTHTHTHLAGFAMMTRMLMNVGAGRVAMALEGG